MGLFEVRGRSVTQAGEREGEKLADAGFDDAAITMAYERTCLNTGGMNWHYLNKILTRWQDAGMFTGEQVTQKDTRSVPKGASGQLGQAELEALQRVLQEG